MEGWGPQHMARFVDDMVEAVKTFVANPELVFVPRDWGKVAPHWIELLEGVVAPWLAEVCAAML